MLIRVKMEKGTLKTRGRTTELHLERSNRAEDVGRVFLATVAASAQTFFPLSKRGCVDARHQPALLHTSVLIHSRFGLA